MGEDNLLDQIEEKVELQGNVIINMKNYFNQGDKKCIDKNKCFKFFSLWIHTVHELPILLRTFPSVMTPVSGG